jgi:hypothetical protein
MADTIGSRLSLDDVRASVQRIRTEGEKLVDRLRTDARELIESAPKVVSMDEARKRLDEARKRAESAVRVVRDLSSRRDALVSDLVARAIALVGIARTDRVEQLEQRVADLERRLEALGKREQAA